MVIENRGEVASPEDKRAVQSRVYVRAMRGSDLEFVAQIQRQSFHDYEAWSTQAYLNELSNPNALYLVAMVDNVIVAYGGLWIIMDEAHITTIAVSPTARGKGIGERLLIEMLVLAYKKGARRSTLEVRATNDAAHRLYEKYGFVWVAIRKGYYADNNENADILWVNDMDTNDWRKLINENAVNLGIAPPRFVP